MSFKENIALLLTPNGFWDERPAMTTFMENEVQEGINTAFNLINAECGNLPYKVLEYNAPHLANPETILDKNNEYYRNDYELEQFRQAIITQTQYTLNMGNDFSQGSSTLSTGGMSATVQRPEKRDIIAPGVLKFLQNARLYQLQVYSSATQKCAPSSCYELGRLLTLDTGDIRYVKTYQDNATPGQVAFIDSNKQVSFANPSELSFNVLRAKEVLDRDGEYRQIKDVKNLAFFGQQGSDAMKRTEIIDTIKAYKQFDPNFTYANEEIVWTWNESTRFVDYWKSKQDNNKGHPPQLDATFTWWEKIYNRDVRAKYIYDPVDDVYKMINQFDVNYFGGMTRDEIYTAINASGTTFRPDLIYSKGFVVIRVVQPANALKWFESLQDDNIGHIPEDSPEWWKELPTPAIDVNDVINQIKPYIQEIVEQDVDAKLDTLKTAITTDYAGSEYYFQDEQAFETFLANNPKLQREWFDDIPSVDLSGYAKLNEPNWFTDHQYFNPNKQLVFKPDRDTPAFGTFEWAVASQDLWINTFTGNITLNAANGIVRLHTQAQIKNLQEPTDAQDAATKNYVDTAIANVSIDTTNLAKLNEPNIWSDEQQYGIGKYIYWRGKAYEEEADEKTYGAVSTIRSDLWLHAYYGNIYLNVGADVKFNNPGNIKNLRDPVDAQDAATKAYVDSKGVGFQTLRNTIQIYYQPGTQRGKWIKIVDLPFTFETSVFSISCKVQREWGDSVEFKGLRGYLIDQEGTRVDDYQLSIFERYGQYGLYVATTVDQEDNITFSYIIKYN